MTLSVEQIETLMVGGVIGIVALYAYHHVTRRKETILYRMRLLAVSLGLYFGGMLVLTNMGYPPSTVLVGGILLGLSAKLIVKRPSDSRHIPKHMKRAVIERDLPEGEVYDSRTHHFDHTVAFSLRELYR